MSKLSLIATDSDLDAHTKDLAKSTIKLLQEYLPESGIYLSLSDYASQKMDVWARLQTNPKIDDASSELNTIKEGIKGYTLLCGRSTQYNQSADFRSSNVVRTPMAPSTANQTAVSQGQLNSTSTKDFTGTDLNLH